MASRVFIRVAANARTLATRSRASLSLQWRCLSSTPSWKSKLPSNHSSSISCRKSLPVAGLQSVRWYASDKITMVELEDRVQEVLKLFDKVDPAKVTLDSHFVDDLGLDSLDVVEIVMAFEDEFAVEISDEEAEKILTAKGAVELLKTKLDM